DPFEQLEHVPVRALVLVRGHAITTLAAASERIASRITLSMNDERDIAARWFWIAVAATASGVAVLLVVFLNTWPVHEDETLALFLGRGSLPHVLHTVIAERGGAHLHVVLAWAVVHLGGGLTGLRIDSLVFAGARMPVIAVLGSHLADRLDGDVTALLAPASPATSRSGITSGVVRFLCSPGPGSCCSRSGAGGAHCSCCASSRYQRSRCSRRSSTRVRRRRRAT